MKQDRPIGLILPEHQLNNKKHAVRALGYIFRAALALLCSYGMTRFVFDSLDLDIGNGFMLAVCAAMCAIFAVMLTDTRLFVGGSVVLIAATVCFIGLHGDLLESLRLAAITVYNQWNKRLTALGYHSASEDIIDISKKRMELGLAESDLIMLAFVLVVLFFSMLCAISIIRRARLLPLLGVGTILSTLMLYFGACDDSFGFSLMLASLCGVVTLCFYDSIYCKKKLVFAALGGVRESADSRRELDYTLRVNSSLGGWAGIASALLALALIAVPMRVTAPMEDIPEISQPVVRVENFLTALARGEAPAPTGLIFGGSTSQDTRPTAAERRVFTGRRIFEVQADVRFPIYLRSWVGTDYVSDSWRTASYERIADYRDTFGSGFSHEYLTSELLRAIDPSLITLNGGERYADHSELGYVTTLVHIDKKAPTTSLLYMPSYTDQRSRLLAYGSHDKPLGRGYSNYYDGIFTSAEYVFVDNYTVLAQLGLAPTEDTAKNIASLVQYYSEQYNILQNMRVLSSHGAGDSELREAYDRLSEKETSAPITLTSGYTFPSGEDSSAWRYAYTMDADERRDIDALMDNLSLYYEFVYDNYLTGCEQFDKLESLVGDICDKRGINMRRSSQSYTGRHEIVTAVIDYLSENMVYTLTPKSPSAGRDYYNSVETFLFDTKEGYCVQYASSAVMLLRAAGIPARYAEGYIAHNFTADGDTARYRTNVRDSNAHAWVEVYYDYYGWVQYEATTPYTVIDVPDEPLGTEEPVSTDTTAPDTTVPTETASKTTDKPTTVPTDITTADSSDMQNGSGSAPSQTAVCVIAAVLAMSVIAVAVILLKRRGDIADQKRRELIRLALDDTLGKDERRDAAVRIGDEIMKLLACRGLVPLTGEAPSRFAARVDDTLGSISDLSFAAAFRAIQAGEFAHTVTRDELHAAAHYFAHLYESTLQGASTARRLWLEFVVLA